MGSCSYRRRSAGRGRSFVVELRDAAAGIAGVQSVTMDRDEVVIHAERDQVEGVLRALRDDPRFAFEQVMDICGVDWPERAERFDVVYNLLSVTLNHRVRVIVRATEDSPVPSASHIWPVATWFERECWDLYGVHFAGLADHRRILTDYGFSGHPLRKDFPLTGYVEVRWDEERKKVVNEPVTLTADFRNFDFVSPWEGMVTLPGDEKARESRTPKPPAEGGPTP